MTDTPLSLLTQWLYRQVPAASKAWLSESLKKMASSPPERSVNLIVSLVTRKVGKEALVLSEADLAVADTARAHWDPSRWSVDQAARVALLLSLAEEQERFSDRLDRLFRTADIGELVAFYQGLPLYPGPERYSLRAAEGIRTNMRVVFEAVAHRNPYPSEQLHEGAWNQMVLKTLFVDSVLHPIIGLDVRANLALAHMLCDYAQERWSAGRTVSPALWRCVAPFASDPRANECLRRALSTGHSNEALGAALALQKAGGDRAQELLAAHAAHAARAAVLDWPQLEHAG